MRKQISTTALVVLLIAGLCLLLYPSLSDAWNSSRQTEAIAEHTEQVDNLDHKAIEKSLKAAQKYNKTLLNKTGRLTLSDEEEEEYENLLNLTGDGIMTYIDIPSINVTLPVYHGVDEDKMQVAIGHIAGSSLPVGGKGTHCVLSGHRGLPSAKLFSDINMLSEGDVFMLHTLDQVLTYQVDQIRVVLPDEVNDLEIDPEQDYCTLVTCTPYGVNTHRLLVRGHRIETTESNLQGVSDALQLDTVVVAPIMSIPLLIMLLIGFMMWNKKKKKAALKEREDSPESEEGS